MANRKTYNSVIQPGYNPSGSQFKPSSDHRSADQLRRDNEKLKMLIKQVQNERRAQIEEEIVDEGGMPDQFQKRIQQNKQKIYMLEGKIAEQNQVMGAYQDKFNQFKDNLHKLMKLDKNIHEKLTHPEQSNTLQSNVSTVIRALNSNQSDRKVLELIEQIKI